MIKKGFLLMTGFIFVPVFRLNGLNKPWRLGVYSVYFVDRGIWFVRCQNMFVSIKTPSIQITLIDTKNQG
jgi:hypothetical protein